MGLGFGFDVAWFLGWFARGLLCVVWWAGGLVRTFVVSGWFGFLGFGFGGFRFSGLFVCVGACCSISLCFV